MPALPLFAFVTPVYNGARFIEGALKAVQAQTYPAVVHVILDNACTDGTDAIIARYAQDAAKPILVTRNAETLPQVQNWNAAVRLVPEEAHYFKILCADDAVTPDAAERIMALAHEHGELVAIGGMERVNGAIRPSHMPAETSIFDAINVIARLLDDDARVSYPHVAYNARFARTKSALFTEGLVGFDVDAVMRALSQGGRFGFVHTPIFDTLHHDASVTSTVVQRSMSFLWENILMAQRYGPISLSNTQLARVMRRHLDVMNRHLLLWFFTRPELRATYLQRLEQHGLAPQIGEYAGALLRWPAHIVQRTRRAQPLAPWPSDAKHNEYRVTA